jgi:hypothetical protein
MCDTPDASDVDTMRDEYDFSGGVRGKHAAHYAEGTNVVLLDADVAEVFRDSPSVNEALRLLVRLARQQTGSLLDRLDVDE